MSEEIIEEQEIVEEEVEKDTQSHEIDSKYRLILLAAQRSKQLQKGADSRVTMDLKKHKLTRVALEEIKQRKINFEFTED